jgi:mannose-6-phosphate isomerase
MLKLETPLLLSPVFKPKIWGRTELAPLFAKGPAPRDKKRLPSGRVWAPPVEMGRVGEAWITDQNSTFMNGPVAGSTLGEISAAHPEAVHGSDWPLKTFPILAKYIFTSEWLSVQVHPDDAAARRFDPGELGKCEMWYVVRGGRRAEFLLGAKPGTTKEALRRACERGTSKALLNHFRPRPSEAIYVPPGTVHALGPDIVLFEVEQNSDLTYRLDDYGRMGLDGRPRPLHLDKGIEIARVEARPRRNLARIKLREKFGWRRYVLACPDFALEELTLTKTGSFAGRRERVEILSVLAGSGRIDTAGAWMGYFPGDTWLIPPGAGPYRIVPRGSTRILKCYVPDVRKDSRELLVRRRVKKAEVQKIVFE